MTVCILCKSEDGCACLDPVPYTAKQFLIDLSWNIPRQTVKESLGCLGQGKLLGAIWVATVLPVLAYVFTINFFLFERD